MRNDLGEDLIKGVIGLAFQKDQLDPAFLCPLCVCIVLFAVKTHIAITLF